jgi:hypothetical protein
LNQLEMGAFLKQRTVEALCDEKKLTWRERRGKVNDIAAEGRLRRIAPLACSLLRGAMRNLFREVFTAHMAPGFISIG